MKNNKKKNSKTRCNDNKLKKHSKTQVSRQQVKGSTLNKGLSDKGVSNKGLPNKRLQDKDVSYKGLSNKELSIKKMSDSKMDVNKKKVYSNVLKEYDCVVIGAGAAGMMAAITAAYNGIKVAIVEHTGRVGSKILQTGNGKCNFTNLDMSKDKFQNEDKDFVEKVINQFDVEQVLQFFEKIGIYHKSKNGYIYPHSETAASVQEALRLELERNNIKIFCNFNIKNIEHKENFMINGLVESKQDGMISEQNININSQSLILATGSMASPKTGSDGSGYKYAKIFGHTVKTPLPALVQLISDSELCKLMSGVRSTGTVKIICNGSIIACDTGEIQYTDYGISGIPVFQVSHYAVKKVYENCKVTAVIDMLPDYTIDRLCDMVKKRMEYDNSKTVEQFFSGLLNRKLVCAVARYCKINSDTVINTLEYKDIFKMLNVFKRYIINITGYKDFSNAQVCQGGINLDEISPQTMQSKLADGLFFAGEVTDVDGICGGYNLQWAWSSGYVAGRSAALLVKN